MTVSGVEVGVRAVGEGLEEVMRMYSVEEIKLVQSKLTKKEKGGRVHTGLPTAILHEPTVIVTIRISTGPSVNIRLAET